MDKEEKFYIEAARLYLKNRIKISEPTSEQIQEMRDTLFHVWLRKKIIFDKRLTDREKNYLLWASFGMTYREISQLLELSTETIRNYEKSILEKMNCRNMKQAIAQGIRYGEIIYAETS